MAYLIVIGSVVVFLLYLVVLRYWAASRASYGFVIIPFVTLLLSAWLDNEPVGVGLALVLDPGWRLHRSATAWPSHARNYASADRQRSIGPLEMTSRSRPPISRPSTGHRAVSGRVRAPVQIIRLDVVGPLICAKSQRWASDIATSAASTG